VLAAALIAVAGLFGLWWASPLAGLSLGLLYGRKRAISAAAVSGLLGWGLGLVWQETRMSLGPVANAVAGIMGVGSGVAVVALTLLISALLAASAAWVGVALRSLGRGGGGRPTA
jgi:hypothetical protein